jgi:hypothetical protein
MLRRSIALLWFVALGCASTAVRTGTVELPTIAYPFSRAVLERDDVATCADRVLALGWYGRVDWERAAFLRIGERGLFTCDVWPAKLQFHAATWTGRIPAGTAAIIHSHPRTLPNPSVNDILEAHRLGIPVIVVTPDAVTMVLPSDGTIVHGNYDSSHLSFRAP